MCKSLIYHLIVFQFFLMCESWLLFPNQNHRAVVLNLLTPSPPMATKIFSLFQWVHFLKNNLYKQHHTMDYLQKVCNMLKILNSSLKSEYLCQWPYISAIRISVIVHKQCTLSVFFGCKLWLWFWWQWLKMHKATLFLQYMAYFSTKLHILLYMGYWL